MGKIDFSKVVNELIDVSIIYKNHFLGKNFLFVDEDYDFMEILCKKDDFAHLTGVYTKLSDAKFYDKCINESLQQTEISFTERFPYPLFKKKMKSLHKLNTLVDGSFNNTRKLFNVMRKKGKFPYAIADIDTTLCFEYKENNILRPKSIRNEKIRDYSTNKRIILIAEKPVQNKLYEKINFGESMLDKCPINIKTKFKITHLHQNKPAQIA